MWVVLNRSDSLQGLWCSRVLPGCVSPLLLSISSSRSAGLNQSAVRLMALLLLLLLTVLAAADNTPPPSPRPPLSFPLFSSPPPPPPVIAAKGLLLFKDTADLLLSDVLLLTVVIQGEVVLGVTELLRATSDEDVVFAKEILEAGHLRSQDGKEKYFC